MVPVVEEIRQRGEFLIAEEPISAVLRASDGDEGTCVRCCLHWRGSRKHEFHILPTNFIVSLRKRRFMSYTIPEIKKRSTDDDMWNDKLAVYWSILMVRTEAACGTSLSAAFSDCMVLLHVPFLRFTLVGIHQGAKVSSVTRAFFRCNNILRRLPVGLVLVVIFLSTLFTPAVFPQFMTVSFVK